MCIHFRPSSNHTTGIAARLLFTRRIVPEQWPMAARRLATGMNVRAQCCLDSSPDWCIRCCQGRCGRQDWQGRGRAHAPMRRACRHAQSRHEGGCNRKYKILHGSVRLVLTLYKSYGRGSAHHCSTSVPCATLSVSVLFVHGILSLGHTPSTMG